MGKDFKMITSQCSGQVLAAKTSTFKTDQGDSVQYGKIQLLVKDASGDFYAVQNIKVQSANFSWLPDVAKCVGKQVTLDLTQNSYNGKVSYYLGSPILLDNKSAA
jgi:hypothetical protein